jgi:hypothetical protein
MILMAVLAVLAGIPLSLFLRLSAAVLEGVAVVAELAVRLALLVLATYMDQLFQPLPLSALVVLAQVRLAVTAKP